MGVINGVGGAIHKDGVAVSTIGEWEVSYEGDLQTFVASNTDGGTVSRDGNTDWSGQYRAKGHTPAVKHGETFAFIGSVDGTNGVSGDAIVDDIEIVIDIESGAIIEHTVNFSANGALTEGAAAASDATDVDAPTSIGCKVKYHTVGALWDGSETELPDVRTVTIRMRSNNAPYNSSSTGGATKRTVGGLEADVSISVYTDDFSALPSINAYNEVRIFVDATDYWEFNFLQWGEHSGLGADIEGQENVEATLNGTWSAYDDAATPVKGAITTPGGTDGDVWGA